MPLTRGHPFFVIPLGFEPKTHSLEGCCSIQLSYGTAGAKLQKISQTTKSPPQKYSVTGRMPGLVEEWDSH